MTRDDQLALLRQNVRDWNAWRGEHPDEELDFIRAELRGAYLRGADLTGADLRGAYLTGAYLSGAYLTGADLSGAYLTGADLTGADLRGAYLTGAYLRGADLSGAYLTGAYLTGAYLRGAYLRGAYLRGAHIDWESHEQIAHILLTAAGRDVEKRKVAGLILISRDWCWEKWLSLGDPLTGWALGELAKWQTEKSTLPTAALEWLDAHKDEAAA